jgi:predicted GIY-YIG superfamily endonuclease
MWFIYILRCADDSLYTGITTDLKRRLEEHNTGTYTSTKYSRARRPVSLVYQEETDSRSSALKREAAIKRLSRNQKELLLV